MSTRGCLAGAAVALQACGSLSTSEGAELARAIDCRWTPGTMGTLHEPGNGELFIDVTSVADDGTTWMIVGPSALRWLDEEQEGSELPLRVEAATGALVTVPGDARLVPPPPRGWSRGGVGTAEALAMEGGGWLVLWTEVEAKDSTGFHEPVVALWEGTYNGAEWRDVGPIESPVDLSRVHPRETLAFLDATGSPYWVLRGVDGNPGPWTHLVVVHRGEAGWSSWIQDMDRITAMAHVEHPHDGPTVLVSHSGYDAVAARSVAGILAFTATDGRLESQGVAMELDRSVQELWAHPVREGMEVSWLRSGWTLHWGSHLADGTGQRADLGSAPWETVSFQGPSGITMWAIPRGSPSEGVTLGLAYGRLEASPGPDLHEFASVDTPFDPGFFQVAARSDGRVAFFGWSLRGVPAQGQRAESFAAPVGQMVEGIVDCRP